MHLKSSGIPILSLLFLCFFLSPPSFSQSFSNSSNIQEPVEGNLKILAVMAEFQPDDNPYTSGDGTFNEGSIPYLEDPGTNVDALPHNRNYFEAHLEFVKNYYEKMSNDKLDIEYYVIPDIITLPKEMAAYSPLGPNPDLSILSELSKDVWESLADIGVDLPNSFAGENTAFVIFHAGIGRDIELTGTTLDRTPQDIPSVYLSRSALAEMFDDPSFSGFPIQGSDILVSNTLIMPRTMTRAGTDVSGNTFLLPLSINGMMTAQIGSHLGLPDLFNTETGQSGIGRFGLMDGASIFAYNGLFPPEMSAWEKMYLGWEQPFQVSTNSEQTFSLPAVSLNDPNSIAKINLSKDEYYLLENRHRDPANNGVTLTIQKSDGSTVHQQFSNFDMEFSRQSRGFDEILEPGVITEVSNYDFALPGGYSEQNDRHLNGGILIWHIDESIIRQQMDANQINNNPDRRGITLIEADGAQDIGLPVSMGLFQNPSNGSPFDFWWSGNDATVITPTGEVTLYQNRFGPDTTPANRSHSGSAASFELFDFSENLSVAEFSLQPVDPFSDLYSLADSRSDLEIQTFTRASDNYFTNYPLSIFPIETVNFSSFVIPGMDGVQIYNLDENTLSSILVGHEDIQQPLFDSDLNRLFIATAPTDSQDEVDIYTFEIDDTNWLLDDVVLLPANQGVISQTESGVIDLDGIPFRYDIQDDLLVPTDNSIIFRTESSAGAFAEISDQEFIITYPEGTVNHSVFRENPLNRLFSGLIVNHNKAPSFYLQEQNHLTLYTAQNGYSLPVSISKNDIIDRPAVTDIIGDGNPDFIFLNRSKNQLFAVNSNGALINYYPISPMAGVTFKGSPLIADLNGNGELNLLVAGIDESSVNLYAYDSSGDLVEGFPILIGGYIDQNQEIINPAIVGSHIVAVSPSGDLKLWHFPKIQDLRWGSVYGNSGNNKSTASIGSADEVLPDFDLLNKEETYNWPNPARDETHIRFQTDGPAEIRIRISTLSGRTIYGRTINSLGGPPEEITIDTSGWSSGGYIARITAKNSNMSESKLVNIAIVK